jgi:hypothetical protein
MAAMLQQPPMKVSTLDSVLRNLASYKVPASPAASAASPPAQRVASKPPPVSTPSPVPSWIKKGGYRNSDD